MSRKATAIYECKCLCGTVRDVEYKSLKRGVSGSCGCLRTEKLVKRRRSHGESVGGKTTLYKRWKSMKQRCYNSSTEGWENYGGRGISVCREWIRSYETFKEWAVTHGYSDELSLDRCDNNGDYSPSNCRWVDRTTQNNNRRSNVKLTAFGETKSISMWGRDPRCPVTREGVSARLERGWDVLSALSEPRRRIKRAS